MPASANPTLTPEAIRKAFDVPSPPTVGLEEEVMLLHPGTLDLLPRASEVLARAPGSSGIKGEMPAAQLELVAGPCAQVPEAAAGLHTARRRLAEAAEGVGRLAAVGVHPFTRPLGELSDSDRASWMLDEYGPIARLQLVFGLHVHVAIRPAARALAVYNALRSYLPLLAALGANSPFLAGQDTGLQSVRPKLSEVLPRQGMPPVVAGFDELAHALTWGMRAGVLADARQWWWELRLHPVFGTLEVRVCDSQPTVAESAAIAAVIQSLCVDLADRHDRGELPEPVPSWRIEENRWSACRYGVSGRMADLRTGEPEPTRQRLASLLADLAPTAAGLGCARELAAAATMLQHPASERHRRLATEAGLRGLVEWLTDRFPQDPQSDPANGLPESHG